MPTKIIPQRHQTAKNKKVLLFPTKKGLAGRKWTLM